ncbi:hypothetical protein [Clostridium beijerinckii]|uniref:hypothetical protein n=1 Tax=Clostridium beijerinckii TaxID=1520 RepID=UPI001360F68E|nr:hypothetical protein [Clostridium beijerinckii]MZK53454.1 hypothetical protein [Clostridium beijerinckii]MZK61592.1 hypothetical protein [Clostridium beijerinckii]MZK71878.1 hypothetical protein [Clostridium beijerinckii]MZK77221.1 hypothetical protein [Clostridium beijerinckii]MZK86849.1 hypothetical protein [Clostridium beijerinckii]
MFKRANKVTALLVAAASVMSMVPAFAADVKKIDSEDGTVYGAVAYKDGSALIDGEVNDNDAAYYFADGKYTELEDIDSGSDYVAYGDKYAKVDDGSDYNVDLSTGKVLDQDLPSDDEDDAASALRKKIKDVDRYGDNTNIADLTTFEGNKFGDTWYYTTDYKAVSGKLGNGLAVNGSYNVYTDKDGNYIDADYNLGKIKVETTSKSATIENTTDTEDLVGTGDASAVVTASKPLGQDKDNLYRYAEITVKLAGGANYGTVKINNKAFPVVANAGDGEVVLPVIQKISKAQDSDDIDDAKYAKTVTNYVISDDSAALDSTAKNFIKNTATKGAVIGGKFVVSHVTDSASDDNVQVQAMTLKSKNGYYYTDLEDYTTATAEFSSDINKAAFDTDVDGNIYILDGGYVKEFDGTDDWNKVYKVDGSFDSLSVYDKDNMVAWSEGDEVYSIIGAKKAADEDTTTPTTPVTTAGWTQTSAGWTYTKADGTKATGWLQDGGAWYYLKADGVMATGWVQDGATWYYLNGSGAMQTGWLNDNGTWYYLNGSGAMLANTTTPDGYYVGANGAWVR